MNTEEAIQEFQCSGCSLGSCPETCSSFSLFDDKGVAFCQNHSVGTLMSGVGHILLGMPVGFNKIRGAKDNQHIYIVKDHDLVQFDFLNVPIWAMEHDGNLLVKVAQPRILGFKIYVILEATMEVLGEWRDKVIDVQTILDRID